VTGPRTEPAGRSWLPASPRRWDPRIASALAVCALGGLNVVNDLASPPWWARPAEAATLLAFGRACGLSWERLGLGRDHLAAGCRWGLGAAGVVAAVYAGGVLLPLTRPAFQDARYHLPLPGVLRTAFLVIPVGTVLAEEVAFRGVLWGLLGRHLRTVQVLAATSLLFGLWHVLPALHLAAANPGVADATGGGVAAVLATVVVTALGGLAFGELRRRSGSVLAPMGAHWATNGLGVLFGALAWRLSA
jgi:membrane protease YdiL (CAAX protease family)